MRCVIWKRQPDIRFDAFRWAKWRSTKQGFKVVDDAEIGVGICAWRLCWYQKKWRIRTCKKTSGATGLVYWSNVMDHLKRQWINSLDAAQLKVGNKMNAEPSDVVIGDFGDVNNLDSHKRICVWNGNIGFWETTIHCSLLGNRLSLLEWMKTVSVSSDWHHPFYSLLADLGTNEYCSWRYQKPNA